MLGAFLILTNLTTPMSWLLHFFFLLATFVFNIDGFMSFMTLYKA